MRQAVHLIVICAALLVFGSCGGDRPAVDSAMIAGSLLLSVIASAVAVYFYRQVRILHEKNLALVCRLNSLSPDLLGDEQEPEPESADEAPAPTAEEALFHDIDAAIRSERLYANVALQGQDIIARFGLNRHVLNDLITAHTGGMSFPQYINAIRMEETVALLRDRPDMTLTDIAAAVGFTPANLREKFKSQYGMTPTEFRRNA